MRFINLGSYNSQFRGLDYCEDKKVIEYKKINDFIYTSKVKGSLNNVYSVVIDIEHPRRSTCNCEHANGRRVICKHMIATYFTIFPYKIDEFNEDLERGMQQYEEEMRLRRLEKEKEITKFVNSLSAKEVRKKLIKYLMDEYDSNNNRYY